MAAFTLAFALALACSESSETGVGADTRSALDSAPAPQGDSVAPPRAEETASEAVSDAAEHPSVNSCLDLVKAGQFAEAIPPCTEAIRRASENREVAAALEQAKSGAMDTSGVEDAAADAVGGLGDRLP